MGQTSAAREPTMEEILASIRRIIESNDPAEGNSAAKDDGRTRPVLSSVAGGLAEDEIDDGEGRAIEPQSIIQMTPDMSGDANLAAPVKPTQKSTISLADVAARLRGAGQLADESDTLQPSPAIAATADAVPAGDSRIERESGYDGHASDADYGGDLDDWSAAHNAGDDQRSRIEPVFAPQQEPHDRNADGEAQVDTPALTRRESQMLSFSDPARDQGHEGSANGNEASEEALAGSLISTTTGKKVAAAFDDLDDAIAKGQMRSFDEIAQDMLAPMLRDWLDDNLPTLVERLVREEIERVARSGRR